MSIVLIKKMFRTIRSTLGQFLAVAVVVAVGMAFYISMNTAAYNLVHSKELFYQECNFADYYFYVIKAPEGITKQIEAVPGVTCATGRIQKDVRIIKADGKRATGRLTGYPLPMETEVNRLYLLQGRLFEEYPPSGEFEVLLDSHYAVTNRLSPGSTLKIVAEGKEKTLTVVGTATSPEFVYPLKELTSMIPTPDTFGIIMMSNYQARQILNMSGQINQIIIKLAPGADEKKISEQIKAILEPYGNLSDYPRKQQSSNMVLCNQIDQLQAQSAFMPSVFFGVAALIQFIVLSRIIKAQRSQIGVMKALGYGNKDIILHYTGYALMAAFLGAALGSLFGTFLASFYSWLYAWVFNLPQVADTVNPRVVLYGLIVSLGVGALAGLTASRGAAAINPAESMRTEPPKSTGKLFLERMPRLWQRLDAAWKMSLRTINRNRARSAVTLLGVVFAAAMLVFSFFAKDSFDYLLDQHYNVEQRYDYLISFNNPVRETELLNISRLEGVLKTEPIFQLPVKIHFMGRSRDELLLGLPPGVSLRKIYSLARQPLQPPDDGLLISELTAEKMNIHVGDDYNSTITNFTERKSELASLRVIGLTNQEISGLLLKEILLQSLAGIALGLPFGRLIIQMYVKVVNTDFYTFPVVVYPQTYILSALGGILFIMAAYRLSARGVKRLDLVEVLKTRD